MSSHRGRGRGFRPHAVFITVIGLIPVGCGAEEGSYERTIGLATPRDVTPGSVPLPVTVAERADLQEPSSTGAPVPPALPRKIIYNATVSLVVENATAAGDRIHSLVKEVGGYVSETDISSESQSQRRATWKVRVPVERFEEFLAAVSRLGELQRRQVDSQDVTQEYYDLEARIGTKQVEEKRLLKHLEDSTGKLEDILAVERELTRVRGEIEQMQGRIRYLANVTALSTVTITVVEIKNYTPPVAPTFATKVGRTFDESRRDAVGFVEGVALMAVALVPWLPLILVGTLAAWLVARRLRRSWSRRAA